MGPQPLDRGRCGVAVRVAGTDRHDGHCGAKSRQEFVRRRGAAAVVSDFEHVDVWQASLDQYRIDVFFGIAGEQEATSFEFARGARSTNRWPCGCRRPRGRGRMAASCRRPATAPEERRRPAAGYRRSSGARAEGRGRRAQRARRGTLGSRPANPIRKPGRLDNAPRRLRAQIRGRRADGSGRWHRFCDPRPARTGPAPPSGPWRLARRQPGSGRPDRPRAGSSRPAPRPGR
jgi:hypothetical protein